MGRRAAAVLIVAVLQIVGVLLGAAKSTAHVSDSGSPVAEARSRLSALRSAVPDALLRPTDPRPPFRDSPVSGAQSRVSSPEAAPPGARAPQSSRAAAASIAGTVTADGDHVPLARARVTIKSTAIKQPRVALSDSRGAYRFDSLPAGDYEVHVVRTGYVLPHAAGGPARGILVAIKDGEARSALAITLQRAATIPGRVLDEDGTPLSGAELEALSLRAADGQPLLVAASARTDDRGDFRLTGLPAGQYFVVARDPAFTDIGDESGALRYAPTFHPGVLSSGEAQPITLSAGQEAARIEFRLRLVRPARLNGTITTPDRARLLSGAVILIAKDVPSTAGPQGGPLPAEDVDFFPDGRCSIRNVPPGKYQLRARAEVDPNQPMWFTSFAVTVEGQNIENIQMMLTPGAIVRGRVEWTRPSPDPAPPRTREPANPRTRDPASPRTRDGIRVRAPLADGTSFGDSLTGTVGNDDTFRLRGVMAGSHYFQVEGLPEPWTVTDVLLQGRSVLDRPVEIREAEQLHDLRIVLSRSTAELQGTVRDARGAPARDTLVVTSAPPPVMPSSANPRFRTTRTDRDGRFRLEGLPPGDYRVTAVAGLDELLAHRREWLDRIAARGTAFSIGSGAIHTLDLLALDANALGFK